MKLSNIRIDGNTQARVQMSEDTVREYADLLKEGVRMPAVTVFFDGDVYWLADGFNRYFAHQMINRDLIDIDIKNGSRLDAMLYACGANDTHGQRRSGSDKRNAVLMVLSEPECKGWADREVARHCKVSHTLVAHVKQSLAADATVTPLPRKPKKVLKIEEPERDESDNMRETIATLNEELEIANRAAAAGVLAHGMEGAREIMERQAQEIKTLQAENDGLRSTRDTIMVEVRELKKQCAYYQKKLKELEK